MFIRVTVRRSRNSQLVEEWSSICSMSGWQAAGENSSAGTLLPRLAQNQFRWCTMHIEEDGLVLAEKLEAHQLLVGVDSMNAVAKLRAAEKDLSTDSSLLVEIAGGTLSVRQDPNTAAHCLTSVMNSGGVSWQSVAWLVL